MFIMRDQCGNKWEEVKSNKVKTNINMVAITENYNNEQIENPVRTVLGNRSYCSTIKYGKKICVVDDSHIKRTKRDLLLCAK